MTSAVPQPNFFSVDENLLALKQTLNVLTATELTSEGGVPNLQPKLIQILQAMIQNPAEFDKYCDRNIQWIGIEFISDIRAFGQGRQTTNASVNRLFTMAYRFLLELEFNLHSSLSPELANIKHFVVDNFDHFGGEFKRQVVFAQFEMPAAILKGLFNRPELRGILDFERTIASVDRLKAEAEQDLNARQERVTLLQSALSKLETGYNFVGLVDGFRGLLTTKREEKQNAFVILVLLSALVIAPLVIEITYIITNLATVKENHQALLFLIPPMIALEVFLVYFFRVVLVHFRSIKAQILQLELRVALCQFIESYSAYARTIKKDDGASLEKFEKLIFSGLTANEEQLPTTFDGAEALAKLFKDIKSP